MAIQAFEGTQHGFSAPETISDALGIALSSGAQALLSAAAQLALQSKRDVGPDELFVAALAIGMPAAEPQPYMSSISSASVSRPPAASRPPNRAEEAHTWLYDWFADQPGGRQHLDQFLRRRVGDTFPLPMPALGTASASMAGIAISRRIAPEAQALLGRASYIAFETMKDGRYGVRHIMASLVLPDRNGNNASLERLAEREFRTKLAGAVPQLLDRVTGRVRSDIAASWRRIFANPPGASIDGVDIPESASGSPEPKSETPDAANLDVAVKDAPATVTPDGQRELPFITLSGFTSDSLGVGNADPLGINPDVQAFARLICLEQATPPLSICLFGEWGSGKSTFMERMQREIARLTRPDRPVRSEQTTTPDEPKLVENVVQIKFNAWHYADANLWASLTAVFFDQLRQGGFDGGRASDYQALIGKVADKVRSLEAGAANALGKVEEAKRKSDTAQKALETVEKQLAANDLTLAWSQLQSDFEDIRKNNEAKLKEIGRRVYRDDLSADSKAFAAAVAEAASLQGRISLIWRVLIGGGWPTIFGVVAVALLTIAGLNLKAIDPTIASTMFQRIAAAGAGGFAALGALWQVFKSVQPIFDGVWRYAKAVEDARTKLTQEAETKRKEAAETTRALKEAELALANARASLSDFDNVWKKDATSTILRYFLFEDTDVRDYEKHVGIVSRARRSFEQLDAIITTPRKKRKVAEEKLEKKLPLSDEEKALLARPKGDGLRIPDRIVLYIDDLDRCTHDQVYDVLQAIHLLLAFELFVVVVGVDVQWIEGAVAKHFEGDVVRTDDDKDRRRKHAIDYLEKIFQIPFWLQKLNTGTGAESKGGSYAAYVQELLKDNVRAEPGTNVFKSALRSPERSAGGAALPEPEVAAQGSATTASDLDAASVEAEDEFGAVDAALASLKLEQAEIDFLASAEIGMLASKSPRAVKRFINIYRIVRARLSDQELEEFLGRSGPPHYPIAALLAAIETGQPIELAETLYPVLQLLRPNDRLDLVWRTAAGGRTGAPTEAMQELRNRFPALSEAISAVDRLCGTNGASVGAYLEMAPYVRRYSFNRYG